MRPHTREHDRRHASVPNFDNRQWATGFKDWFRTRDQRRIDPLTVSDARSHLLIDVRITVPTNAGSAVLPGDSSAIVGTAARPRERLPV